MGKLPLSRALGISHFEAHIYSGHTLLPIYRAERMVSFDMMAPSTRLALASKLFSSHDRISNIEALEERRHKVEQVAVL